MRYAKRTTVSPEKSRAEIERIVLGYKATQFGTAFDNEGGRAMIQFCIGKKTVRFLLPLKDQYADGSSRQLSEQDIRQRWRALVLAIKAKLEAVECNISTFEDEFLSHIVMPDGRTVGEHVVPAIEKAIADGHMPHKLLEFHE